MVILDTNIIIDHIRLNKSPNSKRTALINIVSEVGVGNLAISILTMQELYQGQSTLDIKNEKIMLSIISPLKVIDYSYEIAELAGKILRDSNNGILFVDSAIAATALTKRADLFTLNTKDFQNIKGLSLKTWTA